VVFSVPLFGASSEERDTISHSAGGAGGKGRESEVSVSVPIRNRKANIYIVNVLNTSVHNSPKKCCSCGTYPIP
jgi:hypothetical protein